MRGDILFVDKVFLSKCPSLIRGVELFNLRLIDDLARLGRDVTVVCHRTWLVELNALPNADRLKTITTTASFSSGINFLAVFRSLFSVKKGSASGRFDYLLLGNVTNGLIPGLIMLRIFDLCKNPVVIAHREASRRFISTMAQSWSVLAVNGKIAEAFEKKKLKKVKVAYGVTDAGVYGKNRSKGIDDGLVDLCVLGYLDNPWKGADTAVAAFRMMPADVAKRCKLHLAAYQSPPDYKDINIVTYRWMQRDQIPGFLDRMDVMLVPSRDENVMRETFCQSMVQGMLSGLPVIVNDLPILKEKLYNGGGTVVRDVSEMAEAMVKLAKDSGLRHKMGQDGRRTALDRYVWKTEKFIKGFLE